MNRTNWGPPIFILLLAIWFLLFIESCEGHNVRWCSNPRCGMCNRLQAAHNAQHPHPHIDSTPMPVVRALLKHIKPTKYETLYDLGCGDGRFAITAAKEYGCKAVGVEINRQRAEHARRMVREAGVEDKVTIIHDDARNVSLDDADVIVVYLFPETLAKLQPELFKANRIISYCHRIPNVVNKKWIVKHHGDQPFFVWRAERKYTVGAVK